MTKIIVNSNAIIALYKNERGADLVEDNFSQNYAELVELYMSAVNCEEFLYATSTFYKIKSFEELVSDFTSLEIQLIEIDQELTEAASKYKTQDGIAYTDCFIIATAKKLNAKILTGDKEFKKFEKEADIIWL
jgi:ribonuclease VapC